MKTLTALVALLLSLSSLSEIPAEISQAYEDKDYKTVFLLLKDLAEQGDSDGQLLLFSSYFEGIGVNKNKDKSLEWLLKSANQNNIYALDELANYYELGIDGVLLQDTQKAINTYKKLIKLNPKMSKYYEYSIALIYKYSIMDNTKAMHWYDKSAKKGHYLSQISLADLLLKQSKWKDDANEYKQKAKVLIQKVFESKSSPKFIREHAEDLWDKYRLGDLLVE
ncbi:MAG: tetratricopeptide repeat protein [Candidatus Thioglobus sp.]